MALTFGSITEVIKSNHAWSFAQVPAHVCIYSSFNHFAFVRYLLYTQILQIPHKGKASLLLAVIRLAINSNICSIICMQYCLAVYQPHKIALIQIEANMLPLFSLMGFWGGLYGVVCVWKMILMECEVSVCCCGGKLWGACGHLLITRNLDKKKASVLMHLQNGAWFILALISNRLESYGARCDSAIHAAEIWLYLPHLIQ